MPPGSSMRPTGLHHSAEGAQPPSLGTPRHRQHLDQFSPAVARLMPSGCPHRTPPPIPTRMVGARSPGLASSSPT